ncbi:hypothetical protein [Streptomyces sp. NBC_00555]|uniref:hypothetical protein n=1 Tax=Streptomyces sp. NBC_00555 TaxID=2903662 RepID=UPI002B1D6895|nr:hypothetical protein [Streptomyces sp. NBC_00555]
MVRRLTTTEASLDAASLSKLQHALGSGFTTDKVMATGPKNPEFLWWPRDPARSSMPTAPARWPRPPSGPTAFHG